MISSKSKVFIGIAIASLLIPVYSGDKIAYVATREFELIHPIYPDGHSYTRLKIEDGLNTELLLNKIMW